MLGRMLARSFTRNIAGDMLGGLGRAAAFGAGAVLVSELVNGATLRTAAAPAGNYMPMQGNSTAQGSSVANIALARIALCYYIAKADGNISPEEQMDLDYMCSSLMNNPNASSNFRTELQAIVNDRSMNFMNVEKYLDRLDVNSLSLRRADRRCHRERKKGDDGLPELHLR